MCYYSTTSGYNEESRSVRINQQEKKKPYPRTEKGKKNEDKQVWRKKTLDRHCAFNAQVISPKA